MDNRFSKEQGMYNQQPQPNNSKDGLTKALEHQANKAADFAKMVSRSQTGGAKK